MPRLRQVIKGWSMRDLEAALRAGDVLHSPVNGYRRYFDDTHVAASGAIAWVDHPGLGKIPLHRIPGLSQPDGSSALARSPALGEHTREVLAELGLAPADIAALAAAGTIRATAS
jgi:crotonobetainyl-CoA:carnitine CoA-transferase CaiB-like acyl-CoA transferase